MPVRVKILTTVATFAACLGALAPLNVLYHEVRAKARMEPDLTAERIAEFESFRGTVQGDVVSLIEPSELSRLAHLSRLVQARYALAPTVVDSRSGGGERLINKQSKQTPAKATVVRQSTHYVLTRD